MRAAGLFATVLVTFLVFVPMQAAILRIAPRRRQILPRLFYETVLWLVKVRVKVVGRAPCDGGGLVVANHLSWTDIPALGAQFSAAFVTKSEVSRWPIIGTFARLANSVFVNRGDRKMIPATNALILERIKTGAHVVLFPEATTHADPQPFHSAHFAVVGALQELAGAPTVQPVAIRYSAPHAPWVGDDALLPHVLSLMANPPVTCELIFCEPLPVAAATTRHALAKRCFDSIAAAWRTAAR